MRTYDEYGGFADLPAVDDDAENVRNSILEMGYSEGDIEVHADIDFNGFKILMKNLRNTIIENWKRHEYTLVFVYYAGHGVMVNNTSYALSNGFIQDG